MPRGPSRRRFIAGAGTATALLTIGSAVVPVRSLISPADAQSDGGIARFAASVEFAAAEAYRAAVASGKLTTKAVIDAVTVFAEHHQQHGEAMKVLAEAEVPVNQALLDSITGQFPGAKDENEVIGIAYELENAAAATYLFALGVLAVPEAVEAVASILPVEVQHAVALGTVLGRSLDDQSFIPDVEQIDGFFDPAKFPVP